MAYTTMPASCTLSPRPVQARVLSSKLALQADFAKKSFREKEMVADFPLPGRAAKPLFRFPFSLQGQVSVRAHQITSRRKLLPRPLPPVMTFSLSAKVSSAVEKGPVFSILRYSSTDSAPDLMRRKNNTYNSSFLLPIPNHSRSERRPQGHSYRFWQSLFPWIA